MWPSALAEDPAFVFDWGFFFQSLFQPSSVFLSGLARTVYISVMAQALGIVLGLGIELCRRSRFRALRWIAETYVWLVRGTPLLVQLVLVYNGLAATNLYRFEDVSIGSVVILGVVQAAIITLAANEAAYMAEIIRAALDAIDTGQAEAAKALGMTPSLTMRLVLLPQAARIVVPPLGNEFNLMMKSTSLVSVIGLQEMFLTAQSINSATFKTFEIFLTVAAYYLALTTVWQFIQRWIERKMGAPTGGVPRDTWRDRLLGGRKPAAVAATPTAGSRQ